MNRIHTTVAITALCIAVVGWHHWSANDLAQTAPIPASAATTADPANTNATSVEAAEASAAQAPSTLRVLDDDYFAEQLAADPDCHTEYVLHPETGQSVPAYRCESEKETHPYESWSEPVLAGLAYGDSVAAEVLGLRHIQSEDPNREALGLMLLYRSVALSGDTEAFYRAMGKRYAIVSENNVPNVHNLKQLFVFAIVSRKLGDTRLRPASLEASLAEADVPASQISELKSDAERILQEMASIESEITGNTTIREALNNA